MLLPTACILGVGFAIDQQATTELWRVMTLGTIIALVIYDAYSPKNVDLLGIMLVSALAWPWVIGQIGYRGARRFQPAYVTWDHRGFR